MNRLLISVAAALALGACATPTVYQPASGSSGVGYTEQRIEADRWQVSFHSGSGASAAQVNQYALRRAAELTLAQGYDWFVVVNRYTEAAGGYNGYGSGVSVGAGGGSGGGWNGGSFGGVGVGLSFPLGGASGPALTTTLDIRMGRGPRPQAPDAYDARDVASSVGGPG
ncbi:hypothetical protein [Caulobacter sp. 17J80-11]|uniref:CC0125/CC1285 family lipoprotein n=1 Tax=Caulobacter sp. 17J80-11 TaxID=2763502 RepID=UPI001653E286|nr:hypothetical protein [Caulobacter sp. 17J80-11]MBC6980655.1 hypothetical protein [Caulobacter sp. 17J80-11]